MRKFNTLVATRIFFGLVVAGACALLGTACGSRAPGPETSTFSRQTTVVPDRACQLVLAGALPDMTGNEPVAGNGFIDEASWDPATQRLRLRGWAAFDTGSSSAMLIVRDPFGLLTFATPPELESYQRPDVATKHPNRPEMLDSGFKVSIATMAGSPGPAAWAQSIEVYGVNATGELTRLLRPGGRVSIGWNRQPDCFAVTVIHASPGFEKVGKMTGNLDSLESGATEGTVRLRGWADFDGSSTASTLVFQLPTSVAPVSIVSHAWMQRPDVREAIDPSRPELARSGFEVVLAINGSADDLRTGHALRMWTVASGGDVPVPVSSGVLRR